jgi:hypothetical protein
MCVRSGWVHEKGSAIYMTEDCRGEVHVRFIGFRVQYDAYLDGEMIGTRNQRGQAMKFIETRKQETVK